MEGQTALFVALLAIYINIGSLVAFALCTNWVKYSGQYSFPTMLQCGAFVLFWPVVIAVVIVKLRRS